MELDFTFERQIEWARTEAMKEGEKIGEARGIEIGEDNKDIKNLRSMMKNLNFTLKQAMDALDIELDRREILKKKMGIE